jgi:hypothetical protein
MPRVQTAVGPRPDVLLPPGGGHSHRAVLHPKAVEPERQLRAALQDRWDGDRQERGLPQERRPGAFF